MWVTLSLQYLTSHQSPVIGGVVRRSTTAPALACRPLPTVRGVRGVVCLSAAASALARHSLPAVRGQGVGLACRHYCIARYQGGQLVGRRVVRECPEVESGGGRRLDVAEMRTLCSSPRWTDHYWPHQFAEGIGKFAGNTLGDRRKRTIGLVARTSTAIGLSGSKPPVPGFWVADSG
ncbi:hypothetical protein BHE74_00044390 [Ensete ventricosum]|nr:hypothetical protein BHE74_00044390 [Ensete ventricosum]